MRQPVIEFDNFSFQYRAQAHPTLNHINLTIYEGEKVLIIGPSGCGKSTLSNCINGLVPFYYEGEISGSLKIKGKETREMSIFELSGQVGTVLQDPDSQFIGLTVAEDIAFKLENECNVREVMEKKVARAAKIVDIDYHLEEEPHNLSGGQKQRVTLAGGMVEDIAILLFDEPLASLDPATGKAAMELIEEVQMRTNKTTVIIEHRLEDVLHCHVDRIIVMNEGNIVADKKPNELLPLNLLSETGIREPLYITALKYAGCEVKAESNPQHIDTLKVGSSCRDKLVKWYTRISEERVSNKNQTLLEFQNISFGYNAQKEILHDVNFEVKKGDMISIVGKNGAGKSTLSKLLCGFYKPTSGRIIFNGRDIEEDTIKERAEKIGMVMQNPNQMISKAMIFDEVALGLRARGVPEEQVALRVHEVLKVCGLYPFRKWPISALSFGQKKRVTIAAILVLKPEVLILDEPTAGQDFKHYTEIMEFLKALNKEGMTIIMITHDMHLMLEYTDRTIVLSEGYTIADDIGANVLTDRAIIGKANLKETSLYKLAVKAGLENPRGFVKCFIDYDRRTRTR
ncbi:MAG: putative transporter ATP-binding protein [Clostridia bacterium]|jgi:energy-coupling factor transport system ATP-binding protein|nr:putative transporter ATP-binding protein [Clostridia bacterium]